MDLWVDSSNKENQTCQYAKYILMYIVHLPRKQEVLGSIPTGRADFLSFLSIYIPFLVTYTTFITILLAYQACEIRSETCGNYSEVIQ